MKRKRRKLYRSHSISLCLSLDLFCSTHTHTHTHRGAEEDDFKKKCEALGIKDSKLRKVIKDAGTYSRQLELKQAQVNPFAKPFICIELACRKFSMAISLSLPCREGTLPPSHPTI